MRTRQFVSFFLVLLLVFTSANITALADDSSVIQRKPVVLTKSGTASKVFSTQGVINGTFYADYSVKYTVSGGAYTINSCTVSYSHFSGTIVQGDLYQPSVRYSLNSTNTVLTITFSCQIKRQLPSGSIEYSNKMTGSCSVNLTN